MGYYADLRAKSPMVEDYRSLTFSQRDLVEEKLPEAIEIFQMLRNKYDENLIINTDADLKSDDPQVRNKADEFFGYYPIGCCREIVSNVFRQFRKHYPFVQELKSQGIPCKRIWGLHKDSFQNAIQFGDHYIDIAQDSFEGREGKFLDSKLEDSEFSTIGSYDHYLEAVENNWGDIYPNIYFPHLSLVFPYFVHNKKENGIHLIYSHAGSVLLRDMLNDYRHSEHVLRNSKYSERELPHKLVLSMSEMAKKRMKQFSFTPRVNEHMNRLLTPVFDRSKFFRIRRNILDFRRNDQENFDKRADILSRGFFMNLLR